MATFLEHSKNDSIVKKQRSKTKEFAGIIIDILLVSDEIDSFKKKTKVGNLGENLNKKSTLQYCECLNAGL